MKNNIKIIGFLLITMIGFISCEEDQIDTYTGSNNIYFTWAEKGAYFTSGFARKDSVGYSYALIKADVTEMLVKVPIAIQGKVATEDRTINVVIDERSTASEGIHYVLPENIALKAGNVYDSIPVIFYRTDEMKDQNFSLILKLEPNENFSTDFQNQIDGENILSLTELELTINDIVQEPAAWYAYYLGDFSAKKIFLMSDLLGFDPGDFEVRGIISTAEMLYFGSFMQRYLNEQRLAGNTVYEEDGNEMVMGLGVQ